MAYGLILLLIGLCPSLAYAENEPFQSLEILFDRGDSQKSLALVDGEILELGDFYQNYRVENFKSNAVVFEHQEDGGLVKFAAKGKEKLEVKRHAVHVFVVKQLKAIHEAQIEYYHAYERNYAGDITQLIEKGLLADGFEDGIKQDYLFFIFKVGKTSRRAFSYEKESVFQAIAEPVVPDEDSLFFSVDELGLVRFGPTKRQVSWGPVWDYAEPKVRLPYRTIDVEDEDSY